MSQMKNKIKPYIHVECNLNLFIRYWLVAKIIEILI